MPEQKKAKRRRAWDLAREASLLDLEVTFNQAKGFAQFRWKYPWAEESSAIGRVRCRAVNELVWDLETDSAREAKVTRIGRESIRDALSGWLNRFRTNPNTVTGRWIRNEPGALLPSEELEEPFNEDFPAYTWIEDNLVTMADALSRDRAAGQFLQDAGAADFGDPEKFYRRMMRKENKRAEEQARRLERMAQLAEKRRQQQGARAKISAPPRPSSDSAASSILIRAEPLPPVPLRIQKPDLEFQETSFPLDNLRGFFLRERASVWWVSNQSDDLLCLEACRIRRLEYQVRTALRVLGPLRGRALLSDEVGLGKTIEAGLVIKELLTRGMVKRFLVLTTPSLVDQWQEELDEKFGLKTKTTNEPAFRSEQDQFWRTNMGLVASLYTLKQPAQLQIARDVMWDILVVDEAHYLRNRDSQAWQAVNALPRQFLLLLTATPVQNSLEELYNLVTLLRPGQLPPPREFRARFIDPKSPRQPREPEELRQLLGEVMIRNTRANAGVTLPPRHAETVIFAAPEEDRQFWEDWEKQFREALSQLNPSQASLWGRLLLQTAGSSPAAWRSALDKFPMREVAAAWKARAPLDQSWMRKCELLPALTRIEGGAVVFTQFLETQKALAEMLVRAGVDTFVINGSTPAAQRQEITDHFRKRGGALLLTQSGTEGRNLQFSRHLVNFDLPWNPMEIEQRIGRLHRLGQQHPVRIYNFVQAGTLQEHLLNVLQDKLNLFELVVGETGLVLGERYSSGEFEEEIYQRWKQSEGRVADAFLELGANLAAARESYNEIKVLDETLFAKDYESV
jgi:superfamily II DNA or RNA helicase